MSGGTDIGRIWGACIAAFATTAALTLALGALVGMVAAWLGGGA